MAKSTGRPDQRPDSEPTKPKRRQAPGKTIEARENQIISMAYDEAERRIRNHTATAAEVVHFLKLGSTQAMLEKAKLEKENKLLEAKTDSLQTQKRIEALYEEAMKSFRTYSGQEEEILNDD
jgi:dsDNA-specific endonuclease/ATPase MutS2